MERSVSSRLQKHREAMKTQGYGSCTVTAPIKHLKSIQALGKMLKQGDPTAEGVITSISDMLSGHPYKPYLTPATEAYEPPTAQIEPGIMNVLTKIAAELGNVNDPDLVRRLERQVQITIDAYEAKQRN